MGNTLRLGELWKCCLKQPSDEAAWTALLTNSRGLFEAIARNAAARWGVTNSADIQDIFQEICLKLSAQAREFRTSPTTIEEAEAYIKKTAANVAIDFLRARTAGKRDQRRTIPVEFHAETLRSDLGVADMDFNVFRNQLESWVEGTLRERSVFLLYYRQGFSAREIAAIPWVGLDTKSVENLLAKLVRGVRQRIVPDSGIPPKRASL